MRIKHTLLVASAIASICTANIGNTSELITNGNFETGDYGQINQGGHTLPGWNTTGYNFLFSPNNVDQGGVTGYYGGLQLWGPRNGSANGLGASPVGGNFIANDGAYWTEPLTQTVSGLTVGQKYDLSFYWAGAQQLNYNGATTEQWKVSFGDEHYATATLNNAEHGFTGWRQEMVTFTATSTSQLLSFLAVGTPNGLPPFSLLDGVSMKAEVPEPGSLALVGLGVGLLGLAARRSAPRSK